MSRKEFDFRSFHECSNNDYETALSEISAGRKANHWIWYIFPQLKILGRSSTAEYFGIKSVREAIRYLEDSLLGSRLVEISTVAVEKLRNGAELRILMGSSVDAFKLRSSATLFYYASKVQSAESNGLFKELMELSEGQLGGPDSLSIEYCEKEIETY